MLQQRHHEPRTEGRMILTAEELASLTRRTRSDAQARALNAMGIPHKRRADGSIVVSRTHVDEWLGVKAEKRGAGTRGERPGDD